MSTVYVVTDGDYSDYHIVGVFSTREKAEAAGEMYNALNKVAEYEIDPPTPSPPQPGYVPYQVDMARDGRVTYTRRVGATEPVRAAVWIPALVCWEPQEVGIIVTAWAKHQQHAVKIANEIRTQLIALNRWPTEEERRKYPGDEPFTPTVEPED